MLERLKGLVDDIGHRNIKLLLLSGPPGSGKSKLLATLASEFGIAVFNVGLEVGRGLTATSRDERADLVADLLRDMAREDQGHDLLLLDNVEVLFEKSLRSNPLYLLKRLAHSQRVVAVWPGELRDDRLIYADMSHPEHRDYSREGVVVLELTQS